MVRECSPRERELSSSKLGRRSMTRTSVPARVSSAASIIPVGPPPAITTPCSVIDTLLASRVLAVIGADREASSARSVACRKPPASQ